MKKRCLLAVAIIGVLALTQGVRAESNHRLGVGANYWTMLDDIDGSIDKDGFSLLATFQYKAATLLKFEADLEVFPDGFQGVDGTAYAPEAYLVLGSTIYGAAGVGVLYSDNDFADDPFYGLRAGLDLEIAQQFHLDLNVNYRFAKWSSPDDMAKDVNADVLMLGAALRVDF